MFQDARLLPWLTAPKHPRRQPGRSRARGDRAAAARRPCRAAENAYPHQLSGGMQRRLWPWPARLSVNPGLLLLDEPFVSLDRPLVQEIAGAVLR